MYWKILVNALWIVPYMYMWHEFSVIFFLFNKSSATCNLQLCEENINGVNVKPNETEPMKQQKSSFFSHMYHKSQ